MKTVNCRWRGVSLWKHACELDVGAGNCSLLPPYLAYLYLRLRTTTSGTATAVALLCVRGTWVSTLTPRSNQSALACPRGSSPGWRLPLAFNIPRLPSFSVCLSRFTVTGWQLITLLLGYQQYLPGFRLGRVYRKRGLMLPFELNFFNNIYSNCHLFLSNKKHLLIVVIFQRFLFNRCHCF